jgi:hypothetical protein
VIDAFPCRQKFFVSQRREPQTTSARCFLGCVDAMVDRCHGVMQRIVLE